METKDLLAKIDTSIDAVTNDIKALKSKGKEDSEQVEALKGQITDIKKLAADAMDTHKSHDKDMKELHAKCKEADDKCKEMQKSLDDVALYAKGKKFTGGESITGFNFKDFHKEKTSVFKDLKEKNAKTTQLATSFTVSHEQLVNNALTKNGKYAKITKAAGNDTEGGNLIGSTNVVIPPTRLAGIYANPLRPVHIREYIKTGETESNQIYFNKESAYTDGTGVTAEGASATQSDFTITGAQVQVRKLNTYLTISKEMMEDADFVDSYINDRVVKRLLTAEDQQLMYGTNVSPQMDGLTTEAQPVEPPKTGIGSSINYFDVLHGAVTQGQTQYYSPNTIFVHPTDYNTMALARDNYGRYQFGDAAILGMPLVANGAVIVKNTAITQGYFLVGDMDMGAQLFTRNEIEVTFSNQHIDNFVRGFITVLVEERIALVIYRANAFIYGNFINAEQSGS